MRTGRQPGEPSHDRNQLKRRKEHTELLGCFGVSEAPAQKLHKSATLTDLSNAATAADKPSSHLVGLVSSAAKAVGAQKQRCREYDCRTVLGAQSLGVRHRHDDQEQSSAPSRRTCPRTCPSTSSAASTKPKGARPSARPRTRSASAAQEGAPQAAPAREAAAPVRPSGFETSTANSSASRGAARPGFVSTT